MNKKYAILPLLLCCMLLTLCACGQQEEKKIESGVVTMLFQNPDDYKDYAIEQDAQCVSRPKKEKDVWSFEAKITFGNKSGYVIVEYPDAFDIDVGQYFHFVGKVTGSAEITDADGTHKEAVITLNQVEVLAGDPNAAAAPAQTTPKAENSGSDQAEQTAQSAEQENTDTADQTNSTGTADNADTTDSTGTADNADTTDSTNE